MKSIICGTARDIERCWKSTQCSLDLLISALDDYILVIVESNSSDNTVKQLQKWCSVDSRRNVISLGYLSETVRTKRIAHCRNEYMNFLRNKKHFEQFEFMIVVDLDDALEIEYDIKHQLETCFSRNDWDAIASNRRGRYYDIWALRSKELECIFDCWEMVDKQISYYNGVYLVTRDSRVENFIRRFQKTINKWVECESAFGGMVIYKTSKILDKEYDGSKTCEHISFNSGLKIFINPSFISGGECVEHLG